MRGFIMQTMVLDSDKFVDCAIVANAEYIFTNDAHFDVLAEISFPQVSVLSLDNCPFRKASKCQSSSRADLVHIWCHHDLRLSLPA